MSETLMEAAAFLLKSAIKIYTSIAELRGKSGAEAKAAAYAMAQGGLKQAIADDDREELERIARGEA